MTPIEPTSAAWDTLIYRISRLEESVRLTDGLIDNHLDAHLTRIAKLERRVAELTLSPEEPVVEAEVTVAPKSKSAATTLDEIWQVLHAEFDEVDYGSRLLQVYDIVRQARR